MCIATHQSTHADEGVAAVAGWGQGQSSCDKQLTATLEEADRMLGAIRGRRSAFSRFGTEHEVGRSSNRTLFDMLTGRRGGRDVTSVLACGVTELINHGCHFYDLGLAMAGDPEPVWASGLVDDPSEWDAWDWRKGDPHGRGWVGPR